MIYSTPTTPIPPDPVFVDKAIAEMQVALEAGLPWLTNAFGRSYTGMRQRGKDRQFKAPFVYRDNGEYLPVEFNDNLQAQCFFEVGEQSPANDYEPFVLNWYEVPVGLIFWVNLKKIDSTTGENYYFAEKLKKDVRDLFRQMFSSAKIISIQENVDDIYAEYSFDQVEYKQYFTYPHCSFKFNFTLQISEEC